MRYVLKHNCTCKWFNLTNEQLTALNSLSADRSLRIMRADKGSGIVLMEQDKYTRILLNDLNNSEFYAMATLTDVLRAFKHIDRTIIALHKSKQICDVIADFLTVSEPQLGKFFGIPKIHKDQFNPPFRHIVSNKKTKTEGIAEFIDFVLNPLVQVSPYFLRDSWDFLNLLFLNPPTDEHTILVTLDIESLYSNIPHDIGIEYLRNYLSKFTTFSQEKINMICSLTSLVLTNNFFHFDGKIFHQTKGVAMGAKLAPAFANLVLAWWECNFLVYLPGFNNILLYRRYIDDLFFVWKGCESDLFTFINSLSDSIPFLKFKISAFGKQVNFLDVLISIDTNSLTWNSTIFRKKTFRNNYLHFCSMHPLFMKVNMARGQYIRLSRIISDDNVFLHECDVFSSFLIERGYPTDLLNSIVKDVVFLRHTNYPPILLKGFSPKKNTTNSMNEIQTTPLVTSECSNTINDITNTMFESRTTPLSCTYQYVSQIHNSGHSLSTHNSIDRFTSFPVPICRDSIAIKKVFYNNWDILTSSQEVDNKLGLGPVFTHKKFKSLRSLFENRDTQFIVTPPVIHSNKGMFTCGKCVACKNILTGASYTFKHNNFKIHYTTYFDCNSDNVVYAAICTLCSAFYIGKTIRKLSTRIKEHCAAIRKCDFSNALAKHSHICPLSTGFKFIVLDYVHMFFGDRNTLLEVKELRWQLRLNANAPPGLNESLNIKCFLKWHN